MSPTPSNRRFGPPVSWWLALAVLAIVVLPGRADAQRVLIVGNSYTYANDLDQMVGALLREAAPPGGGVVETLRVAHGGYRLIQHAADADGTRGDLPLRRHLVTGPATDWDFVVLQEQSQIPGFPDGQPDVVDSLRGAATLHGLASDAGATTVFMMTWGRREGDATNPGLFPDFATMQARLAAGYDRLAGVGTAEHPAYVAPAGLAWERIHDDLGDAGADPLEVGSAFYLLYSGDGSHPGVPGSYLTALVIYASITGRSPEPLAWAPAGMSADDRDSLQAVAAAIVLDPESDRPYPWRGEGGEDAGADAGSADVGTDSGAGDAGSDTGSTDGGVDADDGDADADDGDADADDGDADADDGDADASAPDGGPVDADVETGPTDASEEDTDSPDTVDEVDADDDVADTEAADDATADGSETDSDSDPPSDATTVDDSENDPSSGAADAPDTDGSVTRHPAADAAEPPKERRRSRCGVTGDPRPPAGLGFVVLLAFGLRAQRVAGSLNR